MRNLRSLHITLAIRVKSLESIDSSNHLIPGNPAHLTTIGSCAILRSYMNQSLPLGAPPTEEPSKDLPDAFEVPSIVPMPSAGNLSPLRQSTPLTPVVCDPRAIARLLEVILQKGGQTTRSAAQSLGTSDQSLRQYLKGRRGKPSLYWFIKFCEACGARLMVELPTGDKRF